jgi:colanic acid biosynthesis glycosyl transferase WcaI
MVMRIQLQCPHFEPDLHAATGEVMTKLVMSMVERGHQVDVVTSLPWYKDHDVEPEWRGRPVKREQTEWGTISRAWPFPTDKSKITSRALGFAGFTGLVTACALALPKPDVVMGMSPPIFLGDSAWAVAKRHGIPFVFNVQDIFPDVAVDLGALTNTKVIKVAAKHEANLYSRADAVTVLSNDQQDNVMGKLPLDQGDKVRIIHNFADTERIRPTGKDTPYRHKHGLGGKTVIMYSGNVGLSQSFDLVQAAAEHFKSRPDIHFVINGEGAARPEVDSWAANYLNVTVSDFTPREKVGEVLGAADLHLVLLKKGLAKSSTPSKLYGILAAGRPVLASIDSGSEVANTIDKAGAGVAVPPDSPAEFISALERLVSAPEDLRDMGIRARDFIETWYSPQAQAESYEALFLELTGKVTS